MKKRKMSIIGSILILTFFVNLVNNITVFAAERNIFLSNELEEVISAEHNEIASEEILVDEIGVESLDNVVENIATIVATKNEVNKEEDNYSYIYNISYKINSPSNEAYLKIKLSEDIELIENLAIVGLVEYKDNQLIIKIDKGVGETTGSIEIPVKFKNPTKGDIGKASVVILDEKMVESSNIVHSSETTVVITESITMSKNKVGSEVIEMENGFAEYKISIKNPESKELSGIKIIDRFPDKDFEFNIDDVRIENSAGQIDPNIGSKSYNPDTKEFTYSIDKSYKSTVLNIYIKIKYNNLVVDEVIRNTALIQDRNGNIVTSDETANIVREKATGEFFGKKRASKLDVGYEGTVIWNIVMQNPTSSIIDELSVVDKFPYHMRLNSIDLGNYSALEVNNDMTMEVYIKTKQNSDYQLYRKLVASEVVSDNKLIEIEDEYLTDDNYITEIKISIKNAAKGLLPKKTIRFYTKVMPIYEDGKVIQNNTTLKNTAVFSKVNNGQPDYSASKSDSVNYIRSYEGAISKSLRGTAPIGIGETAKYLIVAQATNTSNLPNPVIWDRLPSNLEFKNYSISVTDRSGNKILTDAQLKENYSISVTDRSGNKILTDAQLKDLLEFEQDGEMLRWKLKYILPKGCRVRIELETVLTGIAPLTVNNVGISTLDIPKVQGVQSTDFPDKNYSENGIDYDGNGQVGDLYVGHSAPFTIISASKINLKKEIKLNNSAAYNDVGVQAKPGDTVDYRLTIKNDEDTNIIVKNLYDILPAVNDKNSFTNTGRGSEFNVDFISNSIIVKKGGNIINNYKILYSESSDPERISSDGKSILGIGKWSDVNLQDVRALRLEFANPIVLSGKEVLEVEYSVKVPTEVDIDLKAKNNFSIEIGKENGDLLFPLSSNIVLINTYKEKGNVELTKVVDIDLKAKNNFSIEIGKENGDLLFPLSSNIVLINTYKEKGNVELTKVDGETNAPLQGAEFELYDTKGTKLGTYITNEAGKIIVNDLLEGEYFFKEIKAPEGYELDGKELKFSIIGGMTSNAEVKAINFKIKGNVELTKVDGETNSKLQGAEFELYDSKGNKLGTYITNEAGKIILNDLLEGEYFFREIKAPEGYELDETELKFSIIDGMTSNAEVKATNFKIKGNVELTKVDGETNAPLQGAEFELYDSKGTKLGTYITNEVGKIIVNDLLEGEYFFKEIKA